MESTVGMRDPATSIDEKSKKVNLGLDSGENEKPCDRCSGARNSGPCAGRAKGTCCCTPNGLPSPLCVHYSPRILGLLNGEKTEFDTAREHWTVMDPESAAEAERIAQDNRKYFDEVLAKHPQWGHFFTRFEDLQLGAKIGEGAQAEIFAASSQSFQHHVLGDVELVAKVWKEGVSLKDLERQWPPQMMSEVAMSAVARGSAYNFPFTNIFGGVFIRGGEFKNRFAFIMQRYECDLRTYIDHRMLGLLHKKSHSPPFNNMKAVSRILHSIAFDLHALHEVGVVHRDIKASNVLLSCIKEVDMLGEIRYPSYVIDYECSMGVIGTGFWRAPEILEQVQKRVPSSKLVFTKEADIYSFGMMCYEVVSGRVPFEGHPQNDYSIVLRGDRPELPHALDLQLKELIVDCWQDNPKLRPSALNIRDKLEDL